MEEHLAKAESDNFLNLEIKAEMDRRKKIRRLRRIHIVELHLKDHFFDVEPFPDDPMTNVHIVGRELHPILEVLRKYNPEVEIIQNYQDGNLDIEIGTFLHVLIQSVEGLNKEKVLLMKNLAGYVV